jgi:predicted signal transduction protein with EAL and GGDEF domain
LQQVAQRLQACVREGDTVARLGGDEFVVMLEGLSQNALEAAEKSEDISQKILTTLNQNYSLGALSHHNTPSIGVTLFSGHEGSAEDLLKQADIAMYQAKKAGRNTMRFFDPLMQEAISSRSKIAGELREALDQNQLRLYYQIQVDRDHNPIGAEALIRWQHPESGYISPTEFIPVAEETGLIHTLGWWVIKTACTQIKAWELSPITCNMIIAVNVSAKQFRKADFAEQVKTAIQLYDINPARLKLEITEGMLLENIDGAIKTMSELRELGVEFSLDDFGTGYSSLQYLKRLPLDQLKIDQSFVRDICNDGNDCAIIGTIIAMAHSLGLDVIAEGVETQEQQQILSSLNCAHYQGYLFSKPVPIEEFEASLRKS